MAIQLIDLRSDTVTRPCPDMQEAMRQAVLGDDVYGEDPTVNELEQVAAEMTGKEAALFVSSGTQGNLLALLSHCQRGEEYLAGQEAHAYRFEGGGAAVLGGIQPQPIAFNERGELPVTQVLAAIKPDDFHFARTRLLCLENTQAGKVLSMSYQRDVTEKVREQGLACHLDGARVFNAAVKLSINIKEICDIFDSVSICLSKGLGAPVGSVLVADAALIARARRWRKMLGGGMRQAGVIAAAGLYALRHNVARLAEDHDNARYLGDSLAQLPGFRLKAPVETSMVQLDLPTSAFAALRDTLAAAGIVVSSQRLVCHRDVSRDDLQRVLAACSEFAASHPVQT